MPISIFSFSLIVIATSYVVRPILRKTGNIIHRGLSVLSIKLQHKRFIKKTYQTNCEKDDCVICLDDYSENHKCTELYCGHKFHKTCIIDWMYVRKTCTLCNTGFVLASGKIYGQIEERLFVQLGDN